MSGYIGPTPVPQATQTRQSFTATANQRSFATLGYEVGHLSVYLNGVKLNSADFTATNSSDIVLAAGCTVNDILEMVAFSTFEVTDGAGLLTSIKTVDGATSGLDADLLDGQHGAYYAPIASPALTGNPTAPTQAESDDSTKIATTAYVVDKITTLIGGAPSTLSDLNELAAAINDDANYNSTLTTALATKLPLAGGAITGDVTFGDNNKAVFGAGSDLQVYHNGTHSFVANTTGDMNLQTTGAMYLTGSTINLYDGSTTRLAVDSSGNIGIGTSVPNSYNAYANNLVVYEAGHGGITIATGTSNHASLYFADGTSGNAAYRGYLDYDHADDSLDIGTGGTHSVTISSGGIVGIGTSNPASDAKLVVSNGGAQGFEVRANSSRIEHMHYNRSAGAYMPVRNNGLSYEWFLQNSSAMVLDSSGNVGINTTSANDKLHVKSGWVRVQAGEQTSSSHNQRYGVRWTQETDAEVARIEVERPAWGGAPSRMNFYTRTPANALTKTLVVDEYGRVTKPYQPAFSVRLSPVSSANYVGGSTVIAKAVTTYFANVGNHFSVSTGRFTAPVSGYYVFGACVRYDAFSGTYFYLTMTKNGALISRHLSTAQGDYLPATVQSAVLMIENDYVMLDVQSAGDTAVVLDGDSNFFGYLVG